MGTSTNETLLGYFVAYVKQCHNKTRHAIKLNWYDWSETHRTTSGQHGCIDAMTIGQKIHGARIAEFKTQLPMVRIW